MIRDYLSIARPNHWFKNVFVLPGAFMGLLAQPPDDWWATLWSFIMGMIATCLVCSSNYTINEWLDGPEDRQHPDKRSRPAADGRLRRAYVYAQWLGLAGCGVALGAQINARFLAVLVALFVMGIIYNVPPLRSKNWPFGDVLSEAINNPIRLLLGWYSVQATAIPPMSLVLAYWMIGAFFMASKRLAEVRHIGQAAARDYRKPFAWYNQERLLVSLVFYSTCFAFFGGIFLIRYRVELVLGVPFIGAMMGNYLHVAFLPNSPVQYPEQLYRSASLMSVVILCWIVIAFCFLIDMPWLQSTFETTLPQGF